VADVLLIAFLADMKMLVNKKCGGYNLKTFKAAFGLDAPVRFLMNTNVNTPFFQVPTPEFGHGSCALNFDTELGINISGLNTAQFYAGARALLGHQV